MTEIHQILAASDTSIHGIILSLEQTPDLDGTSLEAIREFARSVKETGEKLVLARVKNETYEALETRRYARLSRFDRQPIKRFPRRQCHTSTGRADSCRNGIAATGMA